MFYSSSTAYQISVLTGRKCIRYTELAFVIVAVFESGRPQFISKKALVNSAFRANIEAGARMTAEWTMPLEDKRPHIRDRAATIQRRMSRAGLERIVILPNGHVIGYLPTDEFDREVALRIAKDERWQVEGKKVTS